MTTYYKIRVKSVIPDKLHMRKESAQLQPSKSHMGFQVDDIKMALNQSEINIVYVT